MVFDLLPSYYTLLMEDLPAAPRPKARRHGCQEPVTVPQKPVTVPQMIAPAFIDVRIFISAPSWESATPEGATTPVVRKTFTFPT